MQLRTAEDQEYKYKVKLFTPKQKRAMTIKTITQLEKEVSICIKYKGTHIKRVQGRISRKSQFNVDVGYFDGRQTSKVWLVSRKDLAGMYSSSKQGCEIFLWVECAVADDESDEERRPGRSSGTKRQHLEDEEDATYQVLQEKHEDGQYSSPQLHLWAKMINSGTYL